MRLIEVPFLDFKKMIGNVWSGVRWKNLNKGKYRSPSEWIYAEFKIDERDSADLRRFDLSVIKKYEKFESTLTEMYKGDFVSVINYDEGSVYIVGYKGVTKKYKEYKERLRIKIKPFINDRAAINIKRVKVLLDAFPSLHPELKRLYDKGINDRYILKKIRTKFPEIKFSENKIIMWRKLYDLPANKTYYYTCRIDEKVESEILKFYKKGLNDLEIGIAMGINPRKIAIWRNKNNLGHNFKRVPISTDQ